jgi:hypothetical protein
VPKIDLAKFNWYGLKHEAVKQQFEGDLTYVGTFALEGRYLPYAVYHSANPDRLKGHKDYMLLAFDSAFGGVVSGMDAAKMEEHRKQQGIICLACKDVIYSVMRHDFRHCECGMVSVDGGKDYLKIGGTGYKVVEIDLLKGEYESVI